MAEFRGDTTFVRKALTRDEYYARVEELGRPLNWMPQHSHRRDVSADNAKRQDQPMEPIGS